MFGPIVLIVLALLLCLLFLHIAEQGLAAFAELGLVCIALVAALGVALTERTRFVATTVVGALGDRGPPRVRGELFLGGELALALPARSLPLRN